MADDETNETMEIMQSSSVTSPTGSLPRSPAEHGSNKELPFPRSSVDGTQPNQNQRIGDVVSSAIAKGQSPVGAGRRKRKQKPVPNNNIRTPTKKMRPKDDGENGGSDGEDVVNLFVKQFPKSPTGTVRTWKECLKVSEGCKEKLYTLVDEAIKTMTAEDTCEEAKKIISELKNHPFIQEIDMKLEWSKVDQALSSMLDSGENLENANLETLAKDVGCLGKDDTCDSDRDHKNANKSVFPLRSNRSNHILCMSVTALSTLRYVADPIQNRTAKLEKERSHLKAMTQYSNKNETKTYASVAKPKEDFNSDYLEEHIKEQMAGVKRPSPCKAQKELQKAMNDEHSTPWWHSEKSDGNDNRQMKEFAAFYHNLIMRKNTVIVEPLLMKDTKEKKEAYRMKMEETCRLIRNWSLTNIDIPDDKILYFPNEVAGEKDGVQPILYSLLWVLATLDDRKGEDIHRERKYPPLNGQDTRRFVDFEAGEPRPFSEYAFPFSATQVPIEAKNNSRTNQNAESMHQEGMKQNIRHSSKRVMVAFDIGNKGVDSSSTSVLLTPTHVQAVKVSLKGTGSDNIRIETNVSEMFPLVRREAFEKLICLEKNKPYLAKNLFPDNYQEPEVPPGFIELQRLIRASEHELGGIDLNSGGDWNSGGAAATYEEYADDRFSDVEESRIGKMLGSGTHGHVYSCSTKNEQVCVKASRVGETCHIQRELLALQRLVEERPNQIPHLWSMGRIVYNIRNKRFEVPAFMFGPKGSPVTGLRKFLSTDKEKVRSNAEKLWLDISYALKFSHGKNVIHLDVRVENFLYDEPTGSFILADWSCSATLPKQLQNKKSPLQHKRSIDGFRGALAFASAKIHQLSYNKTWEPKPEHDFASLGFSIAAFIAGEAVPWPGFYERIKDRNDSRFDERRKIARSLIEGISITDSSIVDSFDKDGDKNKH